MNDSPEPININSATVEEIAGISGIGRPLAEKIISNRPFNTPGDLLKINGIGKSTLEKLTPIISFESAPQQTGSVPPNGDRPQPGKKSEPVKPVQAKNTSSKGTKASASSPGPEKEDSQQFKMPRLPGWASVSNKIYETVSTNQIASWVTITIILSVLVNVLLFSLINGDIRYIPVSKYDTIQAQIQDIDQQIGTLKTDMNGMRSRLDNLETLSGRVKQVETQIGDLQTQVESSTSRIEQLQKQIGDLNTQVVELQKNTQVFQKFLQGLRDLLNVTDKP